MKKIPLVLLAFLLISACPISSGATPGTDGQRVPHEGRWGIYRLDLDTQATELLFSSAQAIASLRLNGSGDTLLFSQKVGGEEVTDEEIFSLNTDGSGLRRITENDLWDLYPAWSPDGTQIAFLSQRGGSLGIFVMDRDGGNVRTLYDSSALEADIDWVGGQIVFTRDSRIWIMRSDGSDAHALSDPPRAGEWGVANLPFGDYDPRLSPDGSQVVFERLVDDQTTNGNYDLFLIDVATSAETRLTQSGYSQGLAGWSHAGDRLVYLVAAIEGQGRFDLYLMNRDGSEDRNITPAYFPPEFLCHWAVFSGDDTALYFIGEWWAEE